MSVTTTRNFTVREAINGNNVGQIADAMAQIKAGNSLSKIKVTFAALTSAAAQDITTAAAKTAGGTPLGISLATGENFPPIGAIETLRVTAGAAAAGSRAVTDAGGTASATLALLSDDGKTITFEAAVTAFVLTYYPAPSGGADQAFAQAAP